MKISEIIGKKIASTSGKCGYVISVNASGGKIVCFACADSDENEFSVDVKNVISIGDKIIYEDRESAVKSAKPVRLGCAGFDENGNFLGILEDCTFSGGKILKAKIGKKNYTPHAFTCGDVIIVKNAKTLKSDVIKDGEVLLKKGTVVTGEVLAAAEREGEYVQTSLKLL